VAPLIVCAPGRCLLQPSGRQASGHARIALAVV
jgi:hypothetical protein